MSFGDLFSPAARLASIRRQLAPGRVLYIHCDFTVPYPKDKYLLLAAIEPRLIFIVINSGERELVKTNPRWHAAQVPLFAAHYDFLEHDSVVDCTNAQEMTQEEVERQLILDMTRIKGRLSQDTLALVIDAVTDSPGLINRDKTWILNSLTSL